MIEGKFGLFQGDNEQVYFNIRNGDDGIPLEDILPEHMRGDGFADAPIGAYLNMLYMWLCSQERWQAAQAAIAPKLRDSKEAGVEFAPPPLDILSLGLLKQDRIDYDRLREICLLITPYWPLDPQIGLIPKFIADGYTIPAIAKALAALLPNDASEVTSDQKLALLKQRPDVRFADLFMPPEHRGGRTDIDIDAKLKYALSWIRSNQDLGRIAWQTDMRRLGILREGENIDFNRARLISDYIWEREEETPSFEKLLDWLRAQDTQESKQVAAALKSAQKKKKIQRKQKKLKRKRR